MSQNEQATYRKCEEPSSYVMKKHEQEQQSSSWRQSNLYLAPSSQGDGWGVYSYKDLTMGDIVEFAPMLLRFPEDQPAILKDTILNNYHYEHWAWNGVAYVSQFVLSFGYMLYFNHSSKPNISYQQFGREPDLDEPDNSVGLGYYAVCDIPAHTELFCDYGGSEWFKDRGLELVDADEPTVDHHILDHRVTVIHGTSPLLVKPSLKTTELTRPNPDKILYSKLYGGYNKKAFERVRNSHDEEFDLPPYNLDSWMPNLFSLDEVNEKGINTSECTGFGNVVCIENIDIGDTLEVVPVLVLSKSIVKGTIAEPLVLEWKDLESLPDRDLGDDVRSVLFPEIVKENLVSKVKFSKRDLARDETVIFGLAGSLSLIDRSMDEYNACCFVERDPCNDGGFLVRVTATKSIVSGEKVVVKLPAFSQKNLEKIIEELALSGQPVTMDASSEE